MTNVRKPIPIQVARDELYRINDVLDEPRVLIGGLAVQRYVVTRDSSDIDIICDHEECLALIKQLYPDSEWQIDETNDDAYRPIYKINHHHREIGEIQIGPKILERGAYSFLDWAHLLENSTPYKYQGMSLENILVPTCPDLAYTKLISFLNRSEAATNKRIQDLQDLTSLSNQREFSIQEFLSLIARNNAENFIMEKMDLTEDEAIIFSNSSIRRAQTLFPSSAPISPSPRHNLPPITKEKAEFFKQRLLEEFQKSKADFQSYRISIGICHLQNGGFGVRVEIVIDPPRIPPSILDFVDNVTEGYFDISAVSDLILFERDEEANMNTEKSRKAKALQALVGSKIKGDRSGKIGSIGAFLRHRSTKEFFVVTASHIIKSYETGQPEDRKILCTVDSDKSSSWFEIAKIDQQVNNYHLTSEYGAAVLKLTQNKALPKIKVGKSFGADDYKIRLLSLIGKACMKLSNDDKATLGRITALDVDNVPVPAAGGQTSFLRDMIEITSLSDHPFAVPGDSGSAVMSEDGVVFGIIVAGAKRQSNNGYSQITYVAPIQNILEENELEYVLIDDD